MVNSPLHIVVMIGSTREQRFGDVVARWFAGRAQQHEGLELDVVGLAEAALPAVFPRGRDTAVSAFSERLARADGFVVITPEYNHSFPAPLKQAIDLTGAEWKAKPVAFVSYGGLSGGLRAVEQLRQVFAEMHAVTVRDTVSIHGARAAFDAAGLPRAAEAANAGVDKLLRSLAWWARSLREARAAEPYPA
jgi:NAD(P)H-dependent FMN reductase